MEELYDSPRGDASTVSAGGRAMVMLRVTAAAGGGASLAAAAAGAEDEEEGEKDAYLRSLPRPDSGRGPATVSSQSWSRRPIHGTRVRIASPTCLRLDAVVVARG